VATQQATWQAWRVAFYLEGCRWRNGVWRSLQNPIGLAVSILVLVFAMGLAWVFLPQYYWMQPNDPSQRIWLEASPQERRQMSLLYLLIGAAFHLGVVVVGLGFRPYQFLRGFSESDLHFLLATPVPSWRLMRALLVLRATLSLGILIPVYFMVALLLAGRMFPVLVLDYLEQLRAGAWLLIGYWVLRYLQGLFFEFFRFYWALRLRERPWLRWVVLAAVGVWWLLMVGAVVAGWLIAESRGISEAARAEYALNWFPAWLLTLPARAVADAVMAIFTGWTPAMGVMIALWAAGSLWLALRLTRDSRQIVDLVTIGVQLGAGKQTDETDEVPYAVRIQLEQATRGNSGGFRTPALLERWSPTGIGALLWRDLVFTCRQTPVWISALTLIAFPIIFLRITVWGKATVRQGGHRRSSHSFHREFFRSIFSRLRAGACLFAPTQRLLRHNPRPAVQRGTAYPIPRACMVVGERLVGDSTVRRGGISSVLRGVVLVAGQSGLDGVVYAERSVAEPHRQPAHGAAVFGGGSRGRSVRSGAWGCWRSLSWGWASTGWR
jgi:hypothetical protein